MTWWQTLVARELTRLRNDGRAALSWSSRITVAAMASYLVAALIFPGTEPLLAPLTAMLVVQVTPVSLLSAGVDRVVAVVSGVALAVGFATVLPLEWWSLGMLILSAITLGQVLRLRNNLVEVAISGMLVLGVGSLGAEAAASQRIAETLVGAAVGIAANLLFPPKVASDDAGRAIDGLADSLSGVLEQAADELEHAVADGRDVSTTARLWLDASRRINQDIPVVGAALLHAEQGRRLNVRAVGRPDVGPGLRQGFESLEHSSVTIRGMFRALVDATDGAAWLGDDGADDVLLGLAQTFRELGHGVDAFGHVVREEADLTSRMNAGEIRDLRLALEGLDEARTRLEDLLAVDVRPELVELHAAVLGAVKRLQQEMDLDERVRRQLRLQRRLSSGRSETGSPRSPRPTETPEAPAIDPEAMTQPLMLRPARRGRSDRHDKRRT